MNDKITAKSQYNQYRTAIQRLQKKLDQRLESHRVEFELSGSRDWGYPGDLAHVHELLQQAAEFLMDEPIETLEI